MSEMFYEVPKDVPNRCNARLLIGANHGEDHSSMVCTRKAGHQGKHSVTWETEGGPAAVHWHGDERAFEDAEAFEDE